MDSSKVENRGTIERIVAQVSKIVTEMAGIQLGERQIGMVENRLRTRILRLGLEGFEAYLEHLEEHREEESQALLSLLTTHHTYFFREFSHFEFLINNGLNNLIARARARGDKKIRVWSAACSRGQEAYSLGMFLLFHLKEMAPDVDFELWGSDVDPESVAFARNAVYRLEELKQIPAMYSRDQFIRGTGNVQDFAKIRDSLKRKATFEPVNLLDPGTKLDGKSFDLVFCRNVFIYFDRQQIEACTKRLLDHMDDDGYLFVGVSESLAGLNLKIESLGPSIHRKTPAGRKTPIALPPAGAAKAPAAMAAKSAPAAAPAPERPLRVLSVDDSPVILSLLKKVLTREHGFELVHTAPNGQVALDWLKTGKVDVMTLDIHMPELDGVGFLQATDPKVRPPVLVLSSVNRDDPALGQKVLSLGAFDYVEKPSLENLAQAGNEIRAKLRLAARRPSLTAAPSPVTAKVPAPSTKPLGTKVAASTPTSAKPSLTSSSKKKVLIVDDSATIRQLLRQVLSGDPHLEVVAEAELPSQVEGLIEKHRPDVITLDIHMPEMDGVTLLQKIFPKYQIPTVMISSISREEGPQVLQALEIGAVDYIQKPSLEDLKTVAGDIRERIKIAASSRRTKAKTPVRKAQNVKLANGECLIVIGASTGGTEALRHVFEGMPTEIPPVLVVQHIPPVFSAAFASRLNSLCPFEVKEAADGDEVRKNRVLIAPGGTQMGVVEKDGKLYVKITDDAPVNRHKPSVDYLFQSVARAKRPSVVAAVLTGMGADGARELKTLRTLGARTIAQDEATSVVYGMPREAAAMGGAETIKPLNEIAEAIMRFASEGPKKANAA